MKYRQGTKNPLNIYKQYGKEPNSDDESLGYFRLRTEAKRLVERANAGMVVEEERRVKGPFNIGTVPQELIDILGEDRKDDGLEPLTRQNQEVGMLVKILNRYEEMRSEE